MTILSSPTEPQQRNDVLSYQHSKSLPIKTASSSSMSIRTDLFPPTPSSSFIASSEKEHTPREELKIPVYTKYQSMMLQDHSPTSTPHTTVNPDDPEDEGLYLLWTNRMLRDQGHRPYSYTLVDNDDDAESDASEEEDLETAFSSSYYSCSSLFACFSFSSSSRRRRQ
ncbi:hypothetical protein VTP01DRAFT_2185 [Rhizomucor pusillus]|uniref:uncharacterized protein n=1 Tax=Rhizomucor pusillus TaxID=4840 RepID=UPI00374339B2